MGYNEERSDQVSVECFPFASIAEIESEPSVTGLKKIQEQYGRLIANFLIVVALFLLVIRPIIRTVKEIKTTVANDALPSPEDTALLEEEKKLPKFIEMNGKQQREHLDMMTEDQRMLFLKKMNQTERASYLTNMPLNEKAKYYAEKDLYKTVNILKGWISEGEEK
jgi:flagellar M-ring protein FliF